jgi:hypothetical protein
MGRTVKRNLWVSHRFLRGCGVKEAGLTRSKAFVSPAFLNIPRLARGVRQPGNGVVLSKLTHAGIFLVPLKESSRRGAPVCATLYSLFEIENWLRGLLRET